MNSADSGFLKLCREAFKATSDSIADLIGTDEAGSFVGMGADGTPTSRIDRVAEDAIIEVLKNDGRSMRIISEELGELILGDSPEFLLFLTHLMAPTILMWEFLFTVSPWQSLPTTCRI